MPSNLRGVCALSRPRWRRWTVVAAMWICVIAGSLARAEETTRHMLWEVRGAHHRVWLLGSIHMLTASEELLPEAVWQAYAGASRVLMEVDPLQVATQATAPEMRQLTQLPPGHTLEELLGPQRFAGIVRLARTLGLDPAFLRQAQPWYAATTLDAVYLMRLGFDPDRGVDIQVARRAHADGKPVLELESVLQQFNFFAQRPYAQQIRYLRTTLADLPDAHRDAMAALRAWRSGDVRALERQLGRGQRDDPALRAILTTDRNRRWVPRIEALLDDDSEGDTLVVVGAMHLVGRDGLVALLRARGRQVEQR